MTSLSSLFSSLTRGERDSAPPTEPAPKAICGKLGCSQMVFTAGHEHYCNQAAWFYDVDGRGWCFIHSLRAGQP